METNRIEKSIELKAPISRVWRALTDHREFGEWFLRPSRSPLPARPAQPRPDHLSRIGVRQVQSHRPEARARAHLLLHLASLRRRSRRRLLHETPTLVEFTLTPTPARNPAPRHRIRLRNVPEPRRSEAFRMDDAGWAIQLSHIEAYVAKILTPPPRPRFFRRPRRRDPSGAAGQARQRPAALHLPARGRLRRHPPGHHQASPRPRASPHRPLHSLRPRAPLRATPPPRPIPQKLPRRPLQPMDAALDRLRSFVESDSPRSQLSSAHP